MKKCQYCSKTYTKGGIKYHERYCKENPHKELMPYRKIHNEAFYEAMAKKRGRKGHPRSEETRKKISEARKRMPPVSEKTKSKISAGMIKAHSEGRAWNIGMSRWNNEMSYPEKFFTKVIENNFLDKNYKNEYNVGRYSIDFAWVDIKKAIEIDGEQHEKPDYKARDVRKDLLLSQKGWQVLRIRWKDMCNDPKKFIAMAYNFIHNSDYYAERSEKN